MEPYSLRQGQYFAFKLIISAHTLIYYAFAPIVVLAGTSYFGYRYAVDKYNFLFVYRVRGLAMMGKAHHNCVENNASLRGFVPSFYVILLLSPGILWEAAIFILLWG
jgi:hypothetical protein